MSLAKIIIRSSRPQGLQYVKIMAQSVFRKTMDRKITINSHYCYTIQSQKVIQQPSQITATMNVKCLPKTLSYLRLGMVFPTVMTYIQVVNSYFQISQVPKKPPLSRVLVVQGINLTKKIAKLLKTSANHQRHLNFPVAEDQRQLFHLYNEQPLLNSRIKLVTMKTRITI